VTVTVTPDSPVVAPPLEPGALLAPGLEVVEHISRNQVLDVYDAWSHERECRCVVKLLRPDSRGVERRERRLRYEGDLLMRLRHPHLVGAYELIEAPQTMIVLETLTGLTLDALLDDLPRRLPLHDVLGLGVQLCSAVGYLHRKGVLHLDVKPGNIVCPETGQIKLIDLSLARPPGHVRAGLGTRGYRPPEQEQGGEVTAAADVWAIGAVLFEAAAGRPYGESPADLRSVRRVPVAFADAVAACLDTNPPARPDIASLTGVLDSLLPPALRRRSPRADD
jgi:eukaryotic-like serine/threonine-protein kinase